MADLLRRHLEKRLRDVFDQHAVLVWEDPSGVLGPILRELLPPGVTMPEFKGNPLSLRQEIDRGDPWLERKWLLYLPERGADPANDWLRDYKEAYVALPRADLAWAFEVFFRVPETESLRRALASPAAGTLAREFGRYFSDERDRLDEDAVLGALLKAAVNEPAARAEDLVLRYLASDDDVLPWKAMDLLPSLTATIKRSLGLRRNLLDGLAPDRMVLCRGLFAASMVHAGASDAKVFNNVLPAEDHRARWARMLDEALRSPAWRDAVSARVEGAVTSWELLMELHDPVRVAKGPPLALLDRRVEALLLADPRRKDDATRGAWLRDVRAAAETRADREGLDEARRRAWGALAAATRLVERVSERVSALVTTAADDVDGLARGYVAEDGDWQIDRWYRQLPQKEGSLSPNWDEALWTPARGAYYRWVRELAQRFVRAVEKRGAYVAKGFLKHTDFWSALVAPVERVAVLTVDAMRADLARELLAGLRKRGLAVEEHAALAQVPTKTEVGMAALVPRADAGFAVKVEGGELVSYVVDVKLPGAVERTRHTATVLGHQGRKLRREPVREFLRDDAKALRECASEGALPVAWTTDVDDGGEIAAGTTWQVFDEALAECAQFVSRALAAGFDAVAIGTDHGFLVRDPDERGGVPGTGASGGGFVRSLRFAAGHGVVAPALAQLSAKVLGRDGVDVWVPRGADCLAIQGGAGLFVHGGVSPQECALLFLVARSKGAASRTPVPVRLEAPESFSSLVWKVRVVALAVEAPLLHARTRVRVEVRDAQGAPVETSAELTFTPAVTDQEQSVTLTVPRSGEYTLLLQDVDRATVIQSRAAKAEVLGGDGFF